MATPALSFNTGTGSDTQASGSGGTAVFGTAAAYTTNTWTLDGSPNLSAVPTDGSAVLYVNTTSGRKFFDITGVNDGADTVTTTDNGAGTASGLTWAIGGKRNDLNAATNRTLGNSSATNGAKGGWHIVLETNQTFTTVWTLSTGLGDTTAGPVTFRSDGATVRTITASTNAAVFTGGTVRVLMKNLKFACTTTHTGSSGLTASGGNYGFFGCIFGDATNTINSAFTQSSTPTMLFHDCEITSTLSTAVPVTSGGSMFFRNCNIHGAGGAAISITTDGNFLHVEGCLIWGNAGDGIFKSGGNGNSWTTVVGNTIHNNTGDGLDTSTTLMDCERLVVAGNNFTGNGAYGWNGHASTDKLALLNAQNNYGTGGLANTSGARNNVSAGTGDLAVDPGYTNAGSGNFAVGTAAKALGYPDSTVALGGSGGATTSYVDVGGAQRQESASGGMLVSQGMTGGING